MIFLFFVWDDSRTVTDHGRSTHDRAPNSVAMPAQARQPPPRLQQGSNGRAENPSGAAAQPDAKASGKVIGTTGGHSVPLQPLTGHHGEG